MPPSSAIRRAIARLAWASRVVIRSLTSCALTGSSSLTSTSTLGVPGVRVESELIWSTRSAGRISAASTSPELTSSLGFGPVLDVDALDPRADAVADPGRRQLLRRRR